MKIPQRHIFYFMLILLVFVSSCEQIIFTPAVSSDAESTFDYLWDKVNEQYAFFDVKEINWDNIYTQYSSSVYNDMPDDSLFFVMGSMLNELKDGHVNLVSEFNVSRFDITLLGPKNIDYRFVKDNYLGTDYYTTGPFAHDFIAGDQIGYIRYSSFMSGFSDDNILYMLDRYEHTQGLIIDMRQNGGGIISNVYQLLSHLTVSDTVLYTSSIKSGPDHNDFSDLMSLYSSPYDSSLTYTKPIAVLIDRGSYSSTSMFSLATLSLDNIFLVGDTTGGGLGMPNGGQLPNGWTYRFSITRTLTNDGINYENGIPPDIYTILKPSDMALGYDTVIEAALDTLLGR